MGGGVKKTTLAEKASNDLKCILDHGFHFLPPPWKDEWGMGKGCGWKTTFVKKPWNDVKFINSFRPTKPQNTKEVKDIAFLTLTLGWKNEKPPSGPTELDLEAGNLVIEIRIFALKRSMNGFVTQ